MVIFMGTYSSSHRSSSTDDDGEVPKELDNSQTDINDFSDPVGERSESDTGQETSRDDTVSTGDGVIGGAIATEPPETPDPGGEEEERPEQDPDGEEPRPDDTADRTDKVEDIAEGQEDEEEDEQENRVVVVQEVDPLSAMSWGVQPVMKRLTERYGNKVEICYKTAPVRRFEDPKAAKQKWIQSTKTHSMPVAPSFWDDSPPASTELVNKAFKAASLQHEGEAFLRILWVNGIAAGRDISDRGVLVKLASELALDIEQFEEDLDTVAVDGRSEREQLPITLMEIQGNPIPRSGRVYYSDFKTQFILQGLDEECLPELVDFIEKHEPVATAEVMEVYEIEERTEAVKRLENLKEVSSLEIGDEQFWELQK